MRKEDGYTLVEALVAATIMVSIFIASLGAFGAFANQNEIGQKVADAQDRARTALDALAHELRNLASPTAQQTGAVERAGAYDLIFQTVDPQSSPSGQNVTADTRVRYCLGASTTAGSTLYRQAETWTTSTAPAMPTDTACPSTNVAWSKTRAVADHITNTYASASRPVFIYDTSTLSQVTWIVPELFVDANPGAEPAETRLKTGIYLRNQNRSPVAAFTVSMLSAANGSEHVDLNGSGSSDPEGDSLSYVWYDGSTKLSGCNDQVVCDTTLTGSGSHTLSLTVYDSGGLPGSAAGQTVTVP